MKDDAKELTQVVLRKISPEQSAALRAPLPDAAVSPHPTKPYLSSIKAIYDVERLNQVFGIGTWHLKSEIIDNKTSMIVVRSVLTIPEYGIELESFGGNDNGGESSKNFDLGDAYKGATTDALTKICSFLEIGIDVFKGLSKKQPPSNSRNAAPPKVPLKTVSKEIKAPPAKPTITLEETFEKLKLAVENEEEMNDSKLHIIASKFAGHRLEAAVKELVTKAITV